MIDTSSLSLVVMVVGFIFTIYNQYKSGKTDIEERTTQWVKINLKLDNLCQTSNDTKEELKEMKKESGNVANRLTLLEEQIKVANHRIDDLEKGQNK